MDTIPSDPHIGEPDTPSTTPRVSVRARPDLFAQLHQAQEFLDSLGEGLLVLDAAGRVLLCNQTARALLGEDVALLTPDQWRRRYRYLMPDTGAPTNLDAVPLLRAFRGESLTRQEMHVSGEGIRNVWLSVTARPVLDAAGRFEWTYVVFRDINLRVWAQESMRLQDRAIASATEAIVILDARHPHRPIIYVSEGFERLTQYPKDEVLGKDCSFLFGQALEDAETLEAQSELRAERPVALELQNQRKDGTTFWNRLSITPVRDSSGALTHYIAVLSDISELIEKEQKLHEATEQLRAANQRITWANEHMKHNLEAAAKVQRALLPSSLPEIEGLKFAWAYQPDEELSGDILNVTRLDDDHVAMYLLDVTGHGVASAMLSVTVSRLLSPVRSATSLVYEHIPGSGRYTVATAGKVATRLAMRFRWDPRVGQIFTMVYGVLNCRTREFQYACAGHPSPIYVTEQGEEHLEGTNGLPIGIGEGDYEERQLTLAPGSRLYLYSDGITEAMNARHEQYGLDRLVSTINETRVRSLDGSVSQIMKRVGAWREDGSIKDDVSLLAVEIAP